jgi:hypothetical protein
LKSRNLLESIKYIFNYRFANCGLTARCWLRTGDVQSSVEEQHIYCSVIILTSVPLAVGYLTLHIQKTFHLVQMNVIRSPTSSLCKISASVYGWPEK